MGFLCQAGAMNSYGDAALFVLLRICVYTPSSIHFYIPPELQFSLRQTANCPQVSFTQYIENSGRDLEAGAATVFISTDQWSIL